MKPYSLLLATSSLLIADYWGEASVTLAQTEPDLETGDEASYVQSEQSERSATTLFIDDIAQPDAPQPESFSSLSASSSPQSPEVRSPLSSPAPLQLPTRAIAQPELTVTPMQWTPSERFEWSSPSTTASPPSSKTMAITTSVLHHRRQRQRL